MTSGSQGSPGPASQGTKRRRVFVGFPYREPYEARYGTMAPLQRPQPLPAPSRRRRWSSKLGARYGTPSWGRVMFCVNDSSKRNRAVVHRADCEYAASHAAHHKAQGGWYTGYRTAAEALELARSLGRDIARSCRVCRPADPRPAPPAIQTSTAHAAPREESAPDRPPGMYEGKVDNVEDLSVEVDGLDDHPSLRDAVRRRPLVVGPGESERETRNVDGHGVEIFWQRIETGRRWGRGRIVSPAPGCERCAVEHGRELRELRRE